MEIQKRTKHAMKLMLKQRPDVVQMQELTFYTGIKIKPLFESKNYNCSEVESKSVFLMTCVEKAYSTNIAFQKKKFTGRASSNYLLITTFRLGNLEHTFINTQLNSPTAGSAIRKAQFALSLYALVRPQSRGPAILSGDFHLRDNIIRVIMHRVLNNMSTMIVDAAEVLNATYFHPEQPLNHHRYDRVFCNDQWRVVSYGTIGEEQVLEANEKSPYKTISDHRGVIVQLHHMPWYK
jgi:hypothetical protein